MGVEEKWFVEGEKVMKETFVTQSSYGFLLDEVGIHYASSFIKLVLIQNL